MSTASAFMHEIDARKPPLAIEAALQQIASAATTSVASRSRRAVSRAARCRPLI
jgi:hypothetical protein